MHSELKIKKRLSARARRAELCCVCDYVPQWEGPFRKYADAQVRKHLWKFARTCDHDDAMQEAYIVFLRCMRRYAYTVDNAAWFMGLYKQALARCFVDLAARDTRHKAIVLVDDTGDDASQCLDARVGEEANEGELHTMIRQAPGEIRGALALMLNAPLEVLELISKAWADRNGGQQAGSRLLCRMLGRPEDANLLQRVREYLGG